MCACANSYSPTLGPVPDSIDRLGAGIINTRDSERLPHVRFLTISLEIFLGIDILCPISPPWWSQGRAPPPPSQGLVGRLPGFHGRAQGRLSSLISHMVDTQHNTTLALQITSI